MNLNQVTMSVVNMDEAKAFYQLLGFNLIVDTPHYTRFECPDGDATFSLSLSDGPIGTGTVVYFEHPELDLWVAKLQAAGLQFESPPEDHTYLWREAVLLDPSGNKLKLYWAGENRKNPPWRVN